MAQKSMIESVKEEIVGAIKGTGDIVNAVVDTVTGTLTNTIKGTGAVATSLIGALSDTARASIQGVAQVGGDIGAAGITATLLPCVSFRDDRHAPARALIDSGAAVALATNFNPQHTPTLNMQTVVTLACLRLKMTVAEAIAAATINGAHALGCANRVGSLELGKSADLLMLNIADYRDLADTFGTNVVHMTMKRGEVIYQEGAVAPHQQAEVGHRTASDA